MRRAIPLSYACGVDLASLVNGTGPPRHQGLTTLSGPAGVVIPLANHDNHLHVRIAAAG